jgi:hypothetical protein
MICSEMNCCAGQSATSRRADPLSPTPRSWRRRTPRICPLAYLTDRVYLAEGRPQEYGTQVTARDGQWIPRHLRDHESVDDRRAAVGLEPLADYLTRFGDPRPNVLPCQACGTPIEFWLPESGERVALVCPDCEWSTTLGLDPE